MDDVVISVSGVGKCYRVFDNARARIRHHLSVGPISGMREVWALRDINFEIKRGESVAIIGRNGGGKSTLLEILTGTLTPTTGAVSVNGRVSALLELGSGFNPEYSGRDNVILNGLLLGLTKEEILSRFHDIEAFAEIGAAIERPVKTYSSGMMVRLAFAVQVLSDPDILIIDEALSVGDFFFQQKCLTYIRKLRDRGVTLIFVSHDMGAVRDTCERGIFLRGGEVVFDGDNLEAIRLYLSSDRDLPPQITESTNEYINIPERIENPLWVASNAEVKKSSSARLVAVGLVDSDAKQSLSFKMSSRATISAHFQVWQAGRQHVHLEIKNKSNQIVTSLGTFGLKIAPPYLNPGDDAVFEFDLTLAIEAGEYSLRMYLVEPSQDGKSGDILDQTPWLGPIKIFWDYEKEVPPFTGMFGMVCSGKFVHE